MNLCVWVDCDEVLCETIDELIKYPPLLERHIKKSEIYRYNLWEMEELNLSKEEAIHTFFSFFDTPEFFNCKPVKGAYEKVKQLKDNWCKLCVVTARPENIEERTRKWIDKFFPNIFSDFLFMNQFKDNEIPKSKLCKQLWIQLLIDDNIFNILDVNKEDIKGILLDKPWNKEANDNKYLKRVSSWDDIDLSLIEEFLNN